MNERLNIEIGARTDPVIQDLDTKLTKNRKAILVDKRHWNYLNIRKKTKPPYVQSDTQSLPFKNNSSDLLVSNDMFSSSGRMTDLPNWSWIKEDIGDKKLIAKEWFRVTKPGGVALIIETATPTAKLLTQLNSAFTQAGFECPENNIFRGKNIAKLFKRGSIKSKQTYSHPHSFAVVFRKPTQSK